MNVLAIDQGTSATKALVVADGGRVLAEASAPVRPRPGPGGAVEQDPQELLDSIVTAGRTALEAAGEPAEAVGLGNQGETVLRRDRDSGRPLGPALSWQDRRAVVVTRELADRADRLTELTGLPLDPYFAAPKMTWLRREAGEGGVVTTVDAWLNHQLAGAFATDAATASRTLLLDIERVEWSDEASALFGLDPAGRPAIVDCDAPVGETDAFGSAALPVTGLAVDPAGRAVRRVLLRLGRREVHVRDRGLHPRHRRRRGPALGVAPGGMRRVAPRRREHLTGTTAAGLRRLRAEGRRIMPALLEHQVTAVYAGLRAATEHADYQVAIDAGEGYACVGGIRSTGLSASMAIAEHVRDELGRRPRARPAPRTRAARAAHAQPRRAVPAPVRPAGADRGRP